MPQGPYRETVTDLSQGVRLPANRLIPPNRGRAADQYKDARGVGGSRCRKVHWPCRRVYQSYSLLTMMLPYANRLNC